MIGFFAVLIAGGLLGALATARHEDAPGGGWAFGACAGLLVFAGLDAETWGGRLLVLVPLSFLVPLLVGEAWRGHSDAKRTQEASDARS